MCDVRSMSMAPCMYVPCKVVHQASTHAASMRATCTKARRGGPAALATQPGQREETGTHQKGHALRDANMRSRIPDRRHVQSTHEDMGHVPHMHRLEKHVLTDSQPMMMRMSRSTKDG
jgi:hypothetical protein